MELLCYLHPGWEPLIRPAEPTREWMDNTPEAFAYRCLPLNIANAHGWEVLTPVAFEACWNGGNGTGDITVRMPDGGKPEFAPVSIFGQAVLTFHIFGLFRTPPGWNMWVGGSPNRPKDGIFPLNGIIETDWSPYTFTMNWRFTRANHWIRFEEKEPICFFFPVQRGYLDAVTPKLVPMERNPQLMAEFKAWSASRDAFQAKMAKSTPAAGTEKWQKRYYRGVDMQDAPRIKDHQIKLRLAAFAPGEPLPPGAAPAAPAAAVPAASLKDPEPLAAGLDAATLAKAIKAVGSELAAGADREPLHARLVAIGLSPDEATRALDAAADNPLVAAARRSTRLLRKRDWLLDTIARHAELRAANAIIERRAGLSGEEFLDRYYAAGRPVILIGETADWPALARWTPAYLRKVVGDRVIEFQGERRSDPRFEMYKDQHRREMPFDQFIDLITRPEAGNDAYMTAYNSARNADAIRLLHGDLRLLGKFLDGNDANPHGMMWIGPAGTITSLHHDLTNNLIGQFVGRKHLKIVAAADVARIYNHHHVFSEVADIEAPDLDLARFPALRELRVYDVTLSPGELLFMPIGWWHQVRALDFSVTITYTNFRWPNDRFRSYPGD